ncbi:MAG: hypothetical protein RJA36_2650, partial [Pseudomonadota bacterium]
KTREFIAAHIGEALGIKPGALPALLEPALAARLVFRRQKDRTRPTAPWFYSLTDLNAQQRQFTRSKPADWMPRPANLEPDTPRPDSQQVLKADAARRDATDREQPATTSPGVGPMGAGQPADAGPTEDHESAAQQEAPTNPGRVEPAAPPAAPPPAEQPRSVDERFAAALDKAMQPQHVTAATFTLRCSGTLDIRADDLLLRLNDEQVGRLRRLLGAAG